MRPQITAYLYSDTKKWLVTYADRLGLDRSEVVRMLLEREKNVRWLEWAVKTDDPEKASSERLSRPPAGSKLRWEKPPKAKHRKF